MVYGLLGMTDGVASDSNLYNDWYDSPYYYESSSELAINSDIIHIFPIIFDDDDDSEEDEFKTLASVSGGKYFKATSDDISDIYYQLSLEL